MGKGDMRTRRGKIFAGSFGKTRPKYKKPTFVASETPKPVPAEKPAKKRTAKRIPAAAETVEAPVETVEIAAETPVEAPPKIEVPVIPQKPVKPLIPIPADAPVMSAVRPLSTPGSGSDHR